MPTFDKEQEFLRDLGRLGIDRRQLFMDAVAKMVHDLRTGQGFRSGLRIKGVKDHPGVFEMTQEPDGRATFSYGTSPHVGDIHIIESYLLIHTRKNNEA